MINFYSMWCIAALTMVLNGCKQDRQTTQASSSLSQPETFNQNQLELGIDLVTAVVFDNKQDVIKLLDRGADVNFLSGVRRTPLDYAIIHDRQEIASILKERGGKTTRNNEVHTDKETSLNHELSMKTSVTITRSSTGYDWQRADAGSKQQFCSKIAATMSRGLNPE